MGLEMEQKPETALPAAFTERMRQSLGEDFPAFLKSYCENRYQGLRVNTLKISSADFLKLQKNDFFLESVPWCPDGYYYGIGAGDREIRPGRHVWHEAGMYYIQEPSAMSAAALLQAEPGEKVLDLCAAPGGKSTQIASSMKGEGLLVVNEIHPARAKILSQNVERMGIRNALVCNESPASLAAHFPAFFDRILCDAPCSGEGMFRKDADAVGEWSPEHVIMCADRQFSILLEAEKMLKPGGRLVYSTCTFSEEENEEVISRFLDACPWMEVDTETECPYFAPGKRTGVWRLWPHLLKGEGHGVAVLKKTGMAHESTCRGENYEKTAKSSARGKKKQNQGKSSFGLIPWEDRKVLKTYHDWEQSTLTETGIENLKGDYLFFGENLYRLPPCAPSLNGLKVLRPGLHVGEIKGKVFKPAHALAMALKPEEVQIVIEKDRTEVYRYLTGETLECGEEKGWVLICTDGVSVGWGKAGSGIVKNHYPKGLRVNWQETNL